MGLLDNLENIASQSMQQSSNPTAKIAGGLMQALEQHPGGLQGVMNHLSQNGVDPQALASGQPADSGQIAQGLQGSGLIESLAEKAGVSPQMAQEAIGTVLPMVMAHFTQNGTAAPPASGYTGMAESLLSRFFNK